LHKPNFIILNELNEYISIAEIDSNNLKIIVSVKVSQYSVTDIAEKMMHEIEMFLKDFIFKPNQVILETFLYSR